MRRETIRLPAQRNGRPGWKVSAMEEQRRTRWLMAIKDAFGDAQTLTVQARDGLVHGHMGGVQSKMTPEEVSDLRRILLDAQAEALRQRGGAF